MSLVSHCAAGAWDAAIASLPTCASSALSDTAGPSLWTALHFASATSAAPSSFLHSLLDAGAAIDARASSGSTPLHLAAWHGCVEHVTLLLARGADIAAITRALRTPLHFAARRGHADIVQRLVETGADVNQADSKGMTALHFAADGDHEAAAFALIDVGAACIPANDGQNPLDVARGSASTEILDALRDAYGEDGGNSELGVDAIAHCISDMEDLSVYDSASQPWLGRRLASVLSSRANALARQVLSLKSAGAHEDGSLASALSALSPDELVQAMSAYAVKGQTPAVVGEFKDVIARAVREYRLTSTLLLALLPEPKMLVRELLEAAGIEKEVASKGVLFHTLVNFVTAARAAQSGTLVRTTVQSGSGHIMRKEVYAAVGAGVLFGLLFGLLIPLARKK